MLHLLGLINRDRYFIFHAETAWQHSGVLFQASGIADRQFKICLVLSVHASWHGDM